MTQTYLTTDIIVIVVLIVVLVLVGICAFLIHFYWTKIGVAEIWNTVKWSSMRSSFYRTIRRFSQPNSSKFASERPLSGASGYSNDLNDAPISVLSPNKKRSPIITSYVTPSNDNLNKPVSIIAYNNNSLQQNYATKIGQPIDNTKISNIHEYNDLSTYVQKQRF